MVAGFSLGVYVERGVPRRFKVFIVKKNIYNEYGTGSTKSFPIIYR